MDKGAQERRRGGQRGHAVIEVSLLAPWVFFLFVGVFDFGFYAYSAITTENAARLAAMAASENATVASDSAGACSFVLAEMQKMPNIGDSVTTCPTSKSGISSTQPVAVLAEAIAGPDSTGPVNAARVTVTYQTLQMIPIPGMLMGRLTLTRQCTMRIRED